MNLFLLAGLLAPAAVAAQIAPPSEIDRTVAAMEQRLVKQPPFVAEFRMIRVPPGGPELSGSELLVYLDYARAKVRVRMRRAMEDGGFQSYFSILEGGDYMYWEQGKGGSRGDLSGVLSLMEEAQLRIREDLERLAPRAPDALPRSPTAASVVLDVKSKTDPEAEQGRYRVSLRCLMPPANWLSQVRSTNEARMTEQGAQIVFELPGARKRFIVDRDTGFLVRAEATDPDGFVWRLDRVSLKASPEAPEFPRPANKDLQPLSLGQVGNYIITYHGILAGAGQQALDKWDVLQARPGTARALFSRWGARLIEMWRDYLVGRAAELRVQDLLGSGHTLADLEGDQDRQTTAFAELLQQDGSIAQVARQALEKVRDDGIEFTKDGPQGPHRDSFLEEWRAGLSLEQVRPHVAKVTGSQLRKALQKALVRARQM